MSREHIVDIVSVVFGGKGMGRIDGKVCFVSGALPGEKVRIRETRDTSGFVEGEILEMITPSIDRIAPACQYYGTCGGCQYQHVKYDEEVVLKTSQIKDIFARIAGIRDGLDPDIVPSDVDMGYRKSLTLHRTSKGAYGFYDMSGREVLEIKECRIAAKELNDALGSLPDSCEAGDVTIKVDSEGKVWSSDVQGERFYLDDTGRGKLYMSPKAFSQANKYVADKISQKLDDWTGDSGEDHVFFDPYCGVGFFTFFSGGGYTRKVGIDSSRIAIECAKSTARTGNISDIKFYKGTAETVFFDIFAREKGKRNTVFLDPPRIGVKKEFLEKLATAEGIDKIFYLSCDPSRLARDIKVLISGGRWKCGRKAFFDMFPRTKHIEMLMELDRGI
ncbi:MAG: TRAM domain-containing protein [Candidatus Omnitrophica bacterium]|nr:TRAM domain-containing protein [Candidatus Omnitrophota bacterium]MDD5487510.1 TRAM domain-containing protein [Candidatus Omnitrophota bacterium]